MGQREGRGEVAVKGGASSLVRISVDNWARRGVVRSRPRGINRALLGKRYTLVTLDSRPRLGTLVHAPDFSWPTIFAEIYCLFYLTYMDPLELSVVMRPRPHPKKNACNRECPLVVFRCSV